jgi:hypothetical protein
MRYGVTEVIESDVTAILTAVEGLLPSTSEVQLATTEKAPDAF